MFDLSDTKALALKSALKSCRGSSVEIPVGLVKIQLLSKIEPNWRTWKVHYNKKINSKIIIFEFLLEKNTYAQTEQKCLILD